MTKEERGNILILIKNKYTLYIFIGTLLLIGYGIFRIAPDSMYPLKGGYYSYTIMIICFIQGIIIPILIGSFLGGYEKNTDMLDYKLVTQSLLNYLKVQFSTIFKTFFFILVILLILGGFLDILNMTNTGFYFFHVLPRFLSIYFIWIFWGILSFMLALFLGSPAMSFLICVALFYLEQYTQFTYGILWNQKSFLHTLFNQEQASFAIIQSSFNSFSFSFIYLLILLVLFLLITILYLKRIYPCK